MFIVASSDMTGDDGLQSVDIAIGTFASRSA
jgi:hypothetical protein